MPGRSKRRFKTKHHEKNKRQRKRKRADSETESSDSANEWSSDEEVQWTRKINRDLNIRSGKKARARKTKANEDSVTAADEPSSNSSSDDALHRSKPKRGNTKISKEMLQQRTIQGTTPSSRVQTPLVSGENSQSSSSDYVPPTLSATVLPSDAVVRAPIRNFVPVLLGLEFDSWAEFDAYWEGYQTDNLASYRCRDSASREQYNATHPNNPTPEGFSYMFKRFFCKLGCKQAPRGKGKRIVRNERFQGCIAQIRAVVKRSSTQEDKMVVKITTEKNCHSHNLNKALFAALQQCNEIIDERILEQLDAFVETNTSTKQITDYVSRKTDLPFTPQQIRNLINSRLGTAITEDRLKGLITDFVGEDGNSCLLIQDDWGLTSGIVTQSTAQKEVFNRWGDNLVLDWTHNTNNIGYYLGSLIVTVPTGRGVSVLDFLCINQQAEMLLEVLKYFKDKNPSWPRVESLVIDKDFTEIAALKVALPNAEIFLCQFHAIRCIRRILGSRQYFVPLAKRAETENLFRAMIRASSYERYRGRKAEFVKFAARISPSLVDYFQRCWDSCSRQWSNYGRGRRFSAGNSTTNRIEASWNQYKQLLGKKSSMDQCLRVVFKQQSCVLRDFMRCIGTLDLQVAIIDEFSREIEDISRVLSSYCFKRVQRQWDRNVAYGKDWTWHHSVDHSRDLYRFMTTSGDGVEVIWRAAEPCECNCLFYVSTRLPCQHIFNVMRHRGVSEYKVSQLQPRWSMKEAESMEPILRQTIRKLSHLSEVQGSREPPILLNSAKRRIGYVKIKRGEKCAQPVLSDCEKHNVVQAELFPLINAMQRLPSHEFYARFSDLRSTLNAFKQRWNLGTSAPVDNNDTDDELESGDVNDSDSDDDNQPVHTPPGNYSNLPLDLGPEDDQMLNDLARCLADEPLQVAQPECELANSSQQMVGGCASGGSAAAPPESIAHGSSVSEIIHTARAVPTVTQHATKRAESSTVAALRSQSTSAPRNISAPALVEVAQLECTTVAAAAATDAGLGEAQHPPGADARAASQSLLVRPRRRGGPGQDVKEREQQEASVHVIHNAHHDLDLTSEVTRLSDNTAHIKGDSTRHRTGVDVIVLAR